ncbi:MAG: hypothetical protein HWN67_23140 [Candidatus Helarchaeota archaeon]|nr:hypothetical protein [Candidatus Helarchaeota archaeon]
MVGFFGDPLLDILFGFFLPAMISIGVLIAYKKIINEILTGQQDPPEKIGKLNLDYLIYILIGIGFFCCLSISYFFIKDIKAYGLSGLLLVMLLGIWKYAKTHEVIIKTWFDNYSYFKDWVDPNNPGEKWKLMLPHEVVEEYYIKEIYETIEDIEFDKLFDNKDTNKISDKLNLSDKSKEILKLIFIKVITSECKDERGKKRRILGTIFKNWEGKYTNEIKNFIFEDLKKFTKSDSTTDIEYIFEKKLYNFARRIDYFQRIKYKCDSDFFITLAKILVWGGFCFACFWFFILFSEIQSEFSFMEEWTKYLMPLLQSVVFSLVFMMGIFALISALTSLSFRETVLKLDIPLEDTRVADPFFKLVGDFALLNSIIISIGYGGAIPLYFLDLKSDILFYVITGLIVAFVFFVFLLNMWGCHNLMLHTKKFHLKILRFKMLKELGEKESHSPDYELMKEEYDDITKLPEWAMTPPILAKLVSVAIVPVFGPVAKDLIPQLLGSII